MQQETKRPYYDAERAAKRQADRLLRELRAELGAVVVRRPSDETMQLIEKWKRNEQTTLHH